MPTEPAGAAERLLEDRPPPLAQDEHPLLATVYDDDPAPKKRVIAPRAIESGRIGSPGDRIEEPHDLGIFSIRDIQDAKPAHVVGLVH